MYQEADLHNGWEVRMRSVPPTASYRWEEKYLTLPPRPSRPLVHITSKLDGHTEEVPALPESAEWNKWIYEMTEWQLECDSLRLDVADIEADFSFDYAIVAWRSTEEGASEEWTREIPEDWEFPRALVTHGVAEPNSDNPILDFMNYELLSTVESRDIARRLAFPESGEENTKPITQAEVDAAVRSFRSTMGTPGPAGGVGSDTPSPVRGGEDVSPGQGSVDSSRPQPLFGRLVQGLKRGKNTDDSGG